MNIKKIFQSSYNPEEVSLTVSSIFKVAIFFVGYIAVSKGFDVTKATTQVEAIRDITLSLVPASFTVYHGLQAIYGIVRKGFVDNTPVQAPVVG